MHVRFAIGLLVAVCLLVGPAAHAAHAADDQEVTGQVLDAAGKPLQGAEVAVGWRSAGDRWKARKSVRTDAEGRFVFQHRFFSRPHSLMAFDESQEHGAIVTLDKKAAEAPLVLKLRPTSLVRAAYTNEYLGAALEKVTVSFTAPPAYIAVATHRGAPSFALRLPPGAYRMSIGATDSRRTSQRIQLTRHMREVDLGTADLEPTIIAQHYGKSPPAWHVTDARGVPPETTLADFKGKWVLLEFWGFK